MIWILIYAVVILGVWLGVIAYAAREGLWSILLTLFNLFFGTLMAVNYFEPAARLLVSMWRGIYWFAPGLCFWALLGLFFGIGRFATDALSKVKLKFYAPIEIIGRIVLALTLANYTINSIHLGILVSNVPTYVFTTDDRGRDIVDSFDRFFSLPMYSALTSFSRMPMDERSADVLNLPLKYLQFRKAYASTEGMLAR